MSESTSLWNTEMMTFNKLMRRAGRYAGLALLACIGATASASGQSRYVGYTKDKCVRYRGVWVEDKDANPHMRPLVRGVFQAYRPIIKHKGSRCCGWLWWCGPDPEWSRISSDKNKVPDTIVVWADPKGREIIWWGYKDQW
jgi:hypothetical protein